MTRQERQYSMKRVFVGMSGGVDSSVSAALLARPTRKGFRGYEVTGVFIRIWQPEWGVCTTREDERDAMRVCAKLGIPFRSVDLSAEYQKVVVADMIREYSAGRTPNPDVMCNREIKFGAFLDWALSEGADFIATGHYARRKLMADSFELLASVDAEKDQTYFLWTLKQDQLRHVLFPVGGMKKSEVRTLAKRFGLPNADKKDSQGLCFLGMIDVKEFISRYVPAREGNVLDESGKIIGTHKGAQLYTIGERHGFHGDTAISSAKPLYVARRDTSVNTITVVRRGTKSMHPLEAREFKLDSVNWISSPPLRGEILMGRIRYREPLSKARVVSSGGGKATIRFSTPRNAAAPGQSLVLYRGNSCLGGGIISKVS